MLYPVHLSRSLQWHDPLGPTSTCKQGERCLIFMLVRSVNVLRYHKEMALGRLDYSQSQSHQVKAQAGLADRLSQVSGAESSHNFSILNQAKSSCSSVKESFDDAIGALKLPAGRIAPRGFRGLCPPTFAMDWVHVPLHPFTT